MKYDNKPKNIPELLTINQVCQIFKCHPNTLRNWDRKGILKAIRIGQRRDRRYRVEDVQRILLI